MQCQDDGEEDNEGQGVKDQGIPPDVRLCSVLDLNKRDYSYFDL